MTDSDTDTFNNGSFFLSDNQVESCVQKFLFS